MGIRIYRKAGYKANKNTNKKDQVSFSGEDWLTMKYFIVNLHYLFALSGMGQCSPVCLVSLFHPPSPDVSEWLRKRKAQLVLECIIESNQSHFSDT